MHASEQPSPKKGFALLITITLLAFLVLLLVSLAALTRVETQVANNNQQLAQARQNALMALNIAIGQLQKYVGPDQRTTARSDMDTALANTTTASGRWTGAYGSGAAADYNQSPSTLGGPSGAVVTASDARGSQAKLLNWLVSGNESTAFNPTNDVGTTGNITTPPTVFQFTPGGTVSGLSGTPTALDDIQIRDKDTANQPARLLVGSHTVGASPANYVAAPLVSITAVVPGLGGTAVPVGRYAWWVGDEGSKARVNLPLVTLANAGSASAFATQAANAFVSAQRAAVELVEAVNPEATTTLATADMLAPTSNPAPYDPTDSKLLKLLSAAQLPMLSTANTGVLSTVVKYRYHDLTAYSTSVLSDTYAGGLKKDLSVVLADTTPILHPSPEADTDYIFKPQPNSGSFTSNEFGVPTWGQLRSFAQKTVPNTGVLSPVAPDMVNVAGRSTPTPTRTSVAPIMSYATLGFCYGVRISAPLQPDLTIPGNPLTSDIPGTPIRLGAFPVVVLWNPYSFDISPAFYEVGFRKQGNANFELQAAPVGTTSWSSAHVRERNTLDAYVGAPDHYLRFLIETPVLPAGQSLVFTLNATDIEFQQADYSCRLTHGYRQLNHALLPRVTTMPQPSTPADITTPHMIYRVGVNATSPTGNWWGIATTYFGGGGNLNFGNADYSYSYLRLVSPTVSPLPALPPASFPKTVDPYDTTAVAPATPGLGVLQWMGTFRPDGQYGAAPYGTANGYSKYVPPTKATAGLLRNEGEIGLISTPTFWLPFTMRFSNADTRWLAVANPRALLVSSPPPSSGSIYEPPNWLASPQNNNWPPGLNVIGGVSSPRANAGLSLSSAPPGGVAVDVTLYEFRPHNQPLLSIGQLQHANLSWLADNPAYPIGNSSGNTWISSSPSTLMRQSAGINYGPSSKTTTIYDSSWLLNRALWDRYFVSTIPNAGTGTATDTASTAIPPTLPDPRYSRYGSPTDANLRDASKAAANLVLQGGFNINSTSEQAWRAVLAGVNRLRYDPVAASSSSTELGAALSRFSKPLSAPLSPSTSPDNTTVWKGYRMLDESQIAQFARLIVAEIRSRGPSVSMADFINRRLVDNGAFPQANDKRLNGTLQAAIEATSSINSPTATPYTDLVPSPPAWQTWASLNPFKSSNGANGAAVAVAPRSAKAAFAPQYLTQADILSAVGGGLTARSDTFTIRTYGEVLDAVNSTTAAPIITGRAWCEAVVQRLPDYVEPSGNLSEDAVSALTATNKAFGRRFKIVSYRWLTPNDI